MRINLALWDRILRFIIGVVFLTWAIAGGPWWTYFGAYLILTASWGLCPIYSFLKFKTVNIKDRQMVPPE